MQQKEKNPYYGDIKMKFLTYVVFFLRGLTLTFFKKSNKIWIPLFQWFPTGYCRVPVISESWLCLLPAFLSILSVFFRFALSCATLLFHSLPICLNLPSAWCSLRCISSSAHSSQTIKTMRFFSSLMLRNVSLFCQKVFCFVLLVSFFVVVVVLLFLLCFFFSFRYLQVLWDPDEINLPKLQSTDF